MSAARPQVSWKAIEEDAEVVSADGETAGTVSRVVGDADADVFTGLAVFVSTFGGERFVEAERVRGIWPDRVEVDLSTAAVEALPKYEEPPAVRVRPGGVGVFRRLLRRR